MKSSPRIARQSGLSLVELMVAVTIGLLITLVVTQAYLTGIGSQRTQTDLTRIQETSRFAFDLLSKEIRRAGYRNTYVLGSLAQDFCAQSPTSLPVFTGQNDAATLNLGAVAGTWTILNSSDVLTVSFYGEDNAAGTAADGVLLDCLGNAVRRNSLVHDTLFVAADVNNNNEPTLFCYSDNKAANGTQYSTTAIALVPGVEVLQFLYGEDTDGDGVPNRYVPYSGLTASRLSDGVVSVMAGIVARTPNAVSTDTTTTAKSFRLFGADYAATNDGGAVFTAPLDRRIRQITTSTIAFRNFPLCPS